jgi:hypothetical protein
MIRFRLQAVDQETECIVREAAFEIDDVSELELLVDIERGGLGKDGAGYDLDVIEVEKIRARYRVDFDPRAARTMLSAWHPIDDLPYQVHTNRELLLMLAGTKPLAVFTGSFPDVDPIELPEKPYQVHVDFGRIIKREQILPPDEKSPKRKDVRLGIRRLLYALPNEQWRIDAYLLLLKTAEKAGWNEGFERMEGSLLGYEDWQNDAYIAWQKKRYQAALSNDNTKPNE